MNLNLPSTLLALGAALVAGHASPARAQGTKQKIPTVSLAQFRAVKLPARVAKRASKPKPLSSLPNLGRFSKPGGKAVPRGVGGLTGNDYSIKTAKTVDEWFERLPNWSQANKPLPDKTESNSTKMPDETEDGRSFGVTKTNYSIYDTPTEIITFSPVDGFWLGALVQENGLREGLGSLQEISIPDSKRGSFKVATDIPMGGNFRVIGKPSYSQVSSALGELMQKGNKIKWGGGRTFKLTDNYSEEQTAHALGLDARYLASTISASFSTKRSASTHTITAAFTERAFTAQTDFSGRTRREAFFSPTFTAADARQLVEREYVTPANLPAYIKSITYGRVVLFNLTSKLTESEMQGAINGSFKGTSWAVEPSYKGSEKLKNTEFELQVTALGGPQSGFFQTIPATGFADVLATMKTFLQQDAPMSTMMPISYSANAMRDNQLAALTTTTKYTVTKYAPNAIGERYRLKMWVDVVKKPDDGVADHTYETYGYLRINGDKKWELPNRGKQSAKHGMNDVVEISRDSSHIQGDPNITVDNYYANKKPTTFSLLLMDWDKASSNDQWMKIEQNIDLSQYVGKTITLNNGSGRLTIIVELMEYL